MRSASRQNRSLRSYFINHARVLIASLGYLSRQPIATLMTSAVIAIALALPTGLYVALTNAADLSEGWDNSTRISLFLNTQVNNKQARNLADRLRLHKHIEKIEIISKEDGLAQFQTRSGFGDALKLLDNNPLPIVLTVQPVVNPEQPEIIGQLQKELEKEKQIDLVQLDVQWVKRLYTIIDIATRSIWVVGSLLSLAVLLIIGNTIRLDIQNRREEIEVAKLIGASDAFIRRPFLYTGIWYGLIGGLVALLLTLTVTFLVADPVEKLAGLYQSSFELSGMSLSNSLSLLGIGCFLGLAGSWLAVGRHLSQIEPT